MWWLVGTACLALAAGAFWVQSYRSSRRRTWELAARIPGPKPLPLVGNALLAMVRPEEMVNVLSTLMNEYGDYTGLWLGSDFNVFLKNPSDIKLLLTSNKVNQKGPVYEVLKTYIGPGLLTGGCTWRNRRKIAIPFFSNKMVQHYNVIFNKEAQSFAEVLNSKNHDKTFNVYKDVVRITTQCVCQTLMGLPKEDSLNIYRLNEAIATTHQMYHHMFMKMIKWWLQIPFVYWLVGAKKIEDYYIKLFEDVASDIVEKRRKVLKENNISVFDEKQDVTACVIDRLILSGEIAHHETVKDTFALFTTSQEPIALATSTVLLILAHYPDWQEKVYDEIINVLGPDDTFVSVEDLNRLQCLDMVFKEALRYMPIGAIIQRRVEKEIAIKNGEIVLPINTTLSIPIHQLHRDPRYWEDPDEVKPERFLPENVKKRDPNAFIPFSLGSMDCIGRVFGTTLTKILIVRALRYVILEAEGNIKDLELHVAISVKFAKGYNLRVRRRNNTFKN